MMYIFLVREPIHPYAVYTTQQASVLLQLDPITIQRYIRKGRLKATKLGKIYRISGQALLDLMALDSDSIKLSQDRVKQTENANYTKSKIYLLNHLQGEKYLRLIDSTNNALLAVWNPDHGNESQDELTLKYIGSRIFNSAMSALNNCMEGFCQISYSTQRDLIEIQFLLDLFRSYPSRIKEWREFDDKNLKKKFSPLAVRNVLDKRDGFKEKKRGQRYQQYCKYASHVTYSGFQLLTNDANQVEIGPFYNERKLINCIRDLALNYGYAVISIANLLKARDTYAVKTLIEHLNLFNEVFSDILPQNEDNKKRLDTLNKILKQVNI